MYERIVLTCGGEGTDFPAFTGASIQAAVNQAAFYGGGEVVLSAGTFLLTDSVYMKTGVTLRGQGTKTVLLKDDMVEDDVLHYIGYGHCEIMVAHPEKFPIGTGVYITDSGCGGGFGATQTTVVAKHGNILLLKHPLEHDVGGMRGGRVRNLYPLIKGDFEKRFNVRDLVLDGNREHNGVIDGCRGGCLFLIGCSYVEMTGLECRNYANDGVSYQQCYDILVDSCNVHHCSLNGMHPGSGTIKSAIRNCHIHHNDADGVFYCLRTTHLSLDHNLIEDNHRFGVTVGHHDDYTDIQYNTIRNNGWEGIFFRSDCIPYGSGRNSTVAHNLLENNGYTTDEARTCEIRFVEAVQGVQVFDNVVNNPGKIPMVLEHPCDKTIIWNNNFKPVCQGADDPAGWYSDVAPEKEQSIADFPVTEETLAHLSHICR